MNLTITTDREPSKFSLNIFSRSNTQTKTSISSPTQTGALPSPSVYSPDRSGSIRHIWERHGAITTKTYFSPISAVRNIKDMPGNKVRETVEHLLKLSNKDNKSTSCFGRKKQKVHTQTFEEIAENIGKFVEELHFSLIQKKYISPILHYIENHKDRIISELTLIQLIRLYVLVNHYNSETRKSFYIAVEKYLFEKMMETSPKNEDDVILKHLFEEESSLPEPAVKSIIYHIVHNLKEYAKLPSFNSIHQRHKNTIACTLKSEICSKRFSLPFADFVKAISYCKKIFPSEAIHLEQFGKYYGSAVQSLLTLETGETGSPEVKEAIQWIKKDPEHYVKNHKELLLQLKHEYLTLLPNKLSFLIEWAHQQLTLNGMTINSENISSLLLMPSKTPQKFTLISSINLKDNAKEYTYQKILNHPELNTTAKQSIVARLSENASRPVAGHPNQDIRTPQDLIVEMVDDNQLECVLVNCEKPNRSDSERSCDFIIQTDEYTNRQIRHDSNEQKEEKKDDYEDGDDVYFE